MPFATLAEKCSDPGCGGVLPGTWTWHYCDASPARSQNPASGEPARADGEAVAEGKGE